MQGTPTSPEMVGQIMALYGRAFSTRAIEKELGVSRSTVSKVIANNGVKLESSASVAKQKNQSVSKTAVAVTNAKTKRFNIPPSIAIDAPICNATSRAPYVCTELSYRQPSRA